jgi:hypothetical protein
LTLEACVHSRPGGAFDFDVFGVGDGLVEAASGGVDREDQRGLGGGADGLDVVAEVLDPGGDDGVDGGGGGGGGGVPVGGDDLLADPGAEVFLEVVEVVVELGEPGVAVVAGGFGDAVEDLLRDAFGVVVALEEERFERGEEGELRPPPSSSTPWSGAGPYRARSDLRASAMSSGVSSAMKWPAAVVRWSRSSAHAPQREAAS